MIDIFITKLKNRLELGLPGWQAQMRMAPPQRVVKEFREMDYPGAQKASVLTLFYPSSSEIHFVMIQRPSYDGTHGGQISFPGGKIELIDKSPWHTAIRESNEEIGVNPEMIQFVGRLSPIYIPPSNYFVHAFIGAMKTKPEFILDKKEVESVIETPLEILLNDSIKGEMEFLRNENRMIVPCYQIGERRVWGATAIILSEIEEVIRTMH